MDKTNNVAYTDSDAKENQNYAKIDTKDFEHKAEEHFEKTHGTEVQRKIKAMLFDDGKDEPVMKHTADETKKPISPQGAEKNSKDSIDEKIDNCFLKDKQSDGAKTGKKLSEEAGKKGSVTKSTSSKQTSMGEEYTSVSQNVEIMGRLKRELSASVKQLGIVLLLAIGSLIFDFAVSAGNGPAFLQPGKYTTVFSLISLQFMCFCVMAGFDDLCKGMKNLFSGRPTPESTAFLTVCAVGIHAIVTSIFLSGNTQAVTFCSVGSFAILMMQLYKYLKLRSIVMSFQVVSLKDTKYIANKCGSDCKEASVFSDYISEKSEILHLDGCEFVEGFFKNTCAVSKNDRSVPLMSALSMVVSAVIFALVYIRLGNLYSAFSCFVCCFAGLAPLSVFICNALPMFFAQKRVFRLRSAIIGETACEKFNSAAVMSFDDTLIFPSRGVKVVKIRAFGNYKIDESVIIMSKVFKTVGGPLSTAFENMISASEAVGGGAVLKSVNADGFTVYADGKEYIVGTRSYVSFYGLETPADEYDTNFISNAGSVLYLAHKDELISKFYIKYTINNRFEELLKVLYKEGICAGIRSVDPCINNDLVIANVPTTKCPVSVVKDKAMPKIPQKRAQSREATIVSASTATGFLHTFVVSSKLKQLFGANYVLKVLGFLATAACFLSFALTGNSEKISLFSAMIMQVIWMLPVVVISAFYRWK